MFGFVASVAIIFLVISNYGYAQEYVELKIYPEHVGVFVATGKQQFVAFGVTETGEEENITDQVKWISSDKQRVTIDKNGLATIQPHITFGQVKISCSVPSIKIEASTSLTIVNVEGRTFNGKPTSVDVTTWQGSWPPIQNQLDQATKITLPEGNKDEKFWYEVYLYDVTIGTYNQRWKTIPYTIPWKGFSGAGGLNSMIANVISYDSGKNFWIHSWDYLVPGANFKGGPGGIWDDCWVGMMIHSFCDYTPADCNGRFKTNLYFTAVNNDPKCWGIPGVKK